jgi:spermidine/putrescine transport system substrate-binding protein
MAADSELTIFDWSGFEIDGLFTDYVAKHGDVPTFAFFGDDDEAFQKVASGFKADAVNPCSQMVSKYRDAGLIEPWDTSKLTSLDQLDPALLDSPVFKDEAGLWFLPSYWGATAVAYNTKEVPAEDVATLQVFANPKYAGRISLPDSSDDVWALAYLATGVTDWTAITEEQFQAAAAWLRLAHANVRTYWADPAEVAQLMKSGEVAVSWTWNDGAAAVRGEGVPVVFNRTPTEGASNWYCGYVNFKDSPGSEDKAYDFINAWLEHGSARGLLENFGYAHANDAAMKDISLDELKAKDVDPIEGKVLAQSPLSPEMTERMTKEFELIKSGF